MSAHNVLFDMFRAPFILFNATASSVLRCEAWGRVFAITTAAAEARTLAQPTKAGLFCTVVLDVDGGDLTLTVTGGYNADDATSITFADAGDYVTFQSVKIGSSYYWRVVSQEGTNVALEDFSVDQLTATTLTLNGGTVLAQDLPVTAGVGITGTAANFASKVEKVGTLYKTTIVIDLAGLNSGGTADDIIGADGAGAAHLGQITAAVNGTIFAGLLTCLETPATGDDDIDVWCATEATGVEDTAISALAETKLCNSGNLTSASRIPLTAFPAANKYLYLCGGTGDSSATYSTGILVLELWGK